MGSKLVRGPGLGHLKSMGIWKVGGGEDDQVRVRLHAAGCIRYVTCVYCAAVNSQDVESSKQDEYTVHEQVV